MDNHAETVIEKVTFICKEHGAKTVALFGSRATGFAVPKSDIDIAVDGDNVDFDKIEDEIEELPSLLSVNIVNVKKCKSEMLLGDIKKYGKVLYKA